MFPDVFHTPRLLLRPIAAADAGPIFESYASDPEATRFLTFRTHQSREGVESYIASCLADPPETKRTYVIAGRDDASPRGAFDLRRTGPHSVGLGYVLARRWWKQGLMTEALTYIADWAPRQDGIWRIADVCDVDNLASARVMEKAGFQCEGVLRRLTVHPNIEDRPRDCFSYARVR